MTVQPERRAGVVVLTNRTPGSVHAILTYAVLDRICGREPVDWFGRLAPKRRQAIEQQALDRKAGAEVRRSGTQPSHPLDEHVGDYEHPAYGRLRIDREADGLAWRWRGVEEKLEHRHYDVFITPNRPTVLHPSNRTLTFRYDRQGRIDRIEIPFEEMVDDIVFHRVAAGDVLDPGFRQLCAGDYLHSGRVIEIRLDARGELAMTIPGQPTYRLLPADGRSFRVDTLEGFGVEFRRPSSDAVDAMIFHEPRVTALAPKVAKP